MNADRKITWVSDCLNIIGILIFGLIVAVFVYPFLHEGGHFLAALLVGTDIIEFAILPIPSVVCSAVSLTTAQQIIIGVSGMFLPLFIGILIPRKWFWCWYIRFLLFGISLLAFVISAATIILPNGAGFNPQDDMLRVLLLWPYPRSSFIILLLVCIFMTISMTLWDKPVRKICRKFGI